VNEILPTIYRAVIEGDVDTTQRVVRAALDAGTTAGEVLNSALIPASASDFPTPEDAQAFLKMLAAEVISP
jgi:methanogenic corrinoid protein MtbC1